jgi:hypothetical protein
MPGGRLCLEDKPIVPIEAEMPDLVCSDPIGERTAIDVMHHYGFVREDLERSPVTEISPPSFSYFFSARPKGILIHKSPGADPRAVSRHVVSIWLRV